MKNINSISSVLSRKACAKFFVFALASALAFSVNAQQLNVKAADKQAFAKQAPADAVEVKLERRKVVMANGKETLQDASSAKPGDILEETATYTNKSATTVTKLVASLPIPQNTEFVANSAKPAAASAKASTDGVSFRAMPLSRKVKQANGVETEQLVPLNEYRFLRWYPGELASGKSVVYSARFKIANDQPAVSSSPQQTGIPAIASSK